MIIHRSCKANSSSNKQFFSSNVHTIFSGPKKVSQCHGLLHYSIMTSWSCTLQSNSSRVVLNIYATFKLGEMLCSTMTIVLTGWANSAVKLESIPWIAVTRRSYQPITSVLRQRTTLCPTIVQKTAAVVFENIGTGCATDGPRYADQLTRKILWFCRPIRNCTDARVQNVLFFVCIAFWSVCCMHTSNTSDIDWLKGVFHCAENRDWNRVWNRDWNRDWNCHSMFHCAEKRDWKILIF